MKKSKFKLQLSRLLGITLLLFIATSVFSVARGDTTAALWQGDKKGAVSITLDDGFLSQINNAFPILQQHSFKATFNIATNKIGSDPASYMDANDILALAADGQEIGSHTVTEPRLPDLSYDELIYELSQSQLYLQQLTGQKVDTIAYPYGAYDTNVINSTGNYYIAARSADSLVLNSSSPSSEEFYKLFAIGPHDTYGSGDANATAGLQYWADRAAVEGKWAIEIFHSIGVSGGYDMVSSEAFDIHLDYLVENEPNLWVAPMGAVSEYIYERNAASITTLFQDSNSLRLELHCGLDNRFNTPLTLLTDCPGPWVGKTIQASQNQTPLTAYVVSKNNNYYIMYDALPDVGTIELSVDEVEPFTTVALWQGDKKGVVSITLDDGLTSQIQNAFPILQQHGFKATFYIVSGDVAEDPSAVLALAADGQEIGGHTVTHPVLPELLYDEMIYELSESQLYLQQLTGQEVETIAYPYGAYDTNVINCARNYYIAARSADSMALNGSSPSSDQFYKLFAIGPHDTYGSGDANAIAGLQYWTDRAVSEKKWAIELFHSIGVVGGYDVVSSEAFDTHIDYLAENEPNLWVAPVGTVSEYIYERNAAVINTLAQDSNSLNLDLNCGLDSRFNTPLTLLTHCPEEWIGKNIQARQEQSLLTASVVSEGNDYYIMYNAVPDAGIIKLWVDAVGPQYFTVIASSGANGFIDPNGEILKAYGSSQFFTATPEPYYEVDRWLLDGNSVQTGGNNYTLSDITANHIVAVSFKYAVTMDISSSARTTASFLHTVPDGNNRLLVVSVMFEGDDSVSSISYGGNDLARAVAKASGLATGCGVEIWYLAAPAVGTDNIVVNFATSVDPSGITAVNFTDVYQDSPIGATADANAASGRNITTAINTLSDGSFIFSAATGHGADTNPYTPGAGITELWDSETGTSNSGDAGLWGGILEAPTAGIYTVKTTASVGDDWAIAAIEIKSASTAPLQYSISGYIRNDSNVPIKGVLVSADNGGNSATTGADGYYNVLVPDNWSGTVTPSKAEWTFEPANMVYVNVVSDQGNQNYKAATIYDLDGDGRAGYGDIDVIVGSWLTETVGNICDFNGDNNVNFEDYAEFANFWTVEQLE